MDSAGAQALVERLAQPRLGRIERERNDDRYTFRCLEAHNALLDIQERNRGLAEDETLHIDGCTLPGDHEGPCDAPA